MQCFSFAVTNSSVNCDSPYLASPFKLFSLSPAGSGELNSVTKSGNSQQEVVNVRTARRIKLSAVVINFVMTRLLEKGVLAYKIIVTERSVLSVAAASTEGGFILCFSSDPYITTRAARSITHINLQHL